MKITNLPLADLEISPNNPRLTTPTLDNITRMANSISELGLVHPLVMDNHGVVAGGMRLRAIKQLHELDPDGEAPPGLDGWKIPTVKATTELAGPAENMIRTAMSIVDQYDVIGKLVAQGYDRPRICSALTISNKEIDRAMTVAMLAPEIKDAAHAGKIDFEQIKAWTTAPDTETQLDAFNELGPDAPAYQISNFFRQESIPFEAALFDVTEYQGRTSLDLFNDRGFFLDVKEFERCQGEAINKRVAEGSKLFKNVRYEQVTDSEQKWNLQQRMVEADTLVPGPKLARLEEQTEKYYDAFCNEKDMKKREPLRIKWQEAEEKKNALEESPLSYEFTPAELDNYTLLYVYNEGARVLTWSIGIFKDEPEEKEQEEKEEAPSPEPADKPWSKRLNTYLNDVRLAAMRAELTINPADTGELAFRTMVYMMLIRFSPISISDEMPAKFDDDRKFFHDDAIHDERQEYLPAQAKKLVEKATITDLIEMMPMLVTRTVGLGSQSDVFPPENIKCMPQGYLTGKIEVDVRQWWTPDTQYWSLFNGAQLFKEIQGINKDLANAVASMRKTEAVEMLHDIFAHPSPDNPNLLKHTAAGTDMGKLANKIIKYLPKGMGWPTPK